MKKVTQTCSKAEYNLVCRGIEWELADVCRREGIGIIPWSPLKGGLLTGKYKREDGTPEGSRISHATKKGIDLEAIPHFEGIKKDDKTWKIIDATKNAARAHGKTPAQVAIRWLLQKDVVSSVIIGAKTLQQLEDNMGAATGWEITEEQMAKLDTVSQMEPTYPYRLLTMMNIDREMSRTGISVGSGHSKQGKEPVIMHVHSVFRIVSHS
uniref:NADP-dependent oxidoreductase domain-containing protein n=1 Tax=Branchiostoma floridae TaxID=7739 RepID=C3YB31_BRAFL|eukprot:XP_002606483.1 hypothetical protein BRAFLDRAFT_91936 [Branchiostoma floridae]